MICAYCLLRIAREEAEAGLAETTVTLLPGDGHAAVTMVDGYALCVTHWSEQVRNVVEASSLVAEAKEGLLDEAGRLRLRELCSLSSPGHQSIRALIPA